MAGVTTLMFENFGCLFKNKQTIWGADVGSDHNLNNEYRVKTAQSMGGYINICKVCENYWYSTRNEKRTFSSFFSHCIIKWHSSSLKIYTTWTNIYLYIIVQSPNCSSGSIESTTHYLIAFVTSPLNYETRQSIFEIPFPVTIDTKLSLFGSPFSNEENRNIFWLFKNILKIKCFYF